MDQKNKGETFEFHQDSKGEWRWTRKDSKGNVIGESRHGFDTKELCEFNAGHYGYIKTTDNE